MGGWLFRTARYVLANDARAVRRHRQTLARISQLAPPLSDDLDRHVLEDERLRRAIDTLAQLAARDREVHELAVWSGSSEAQMAAGFASAWTRRRPASGARGAGRPYRQGGRTTTRSRASARAASWRRLRRSTKLRRTCSTWSGAAASRRARPAGVSTA